MYVDVFRHSELTFVCDVLFSSVGSVEKLAHLKEICRFTFDMRTVTQYEGNGSR